MITMATFWSFLTMALLSTTVTGSLVAQSVPSHLTKVHTTENITRMHTKIPIQAPVEKAIALDCHKTYCVSLATTSSTRVRFRLKKTLRGIATAVDEATASAIAGPITTNVNITPTSTMAKPQVFISAEARSLQAVKLLRDTLLGWLLRGSDAVGGSGTTNQYQSFYPKVFDNKSPETKDLLVRLLEDTVEPSDIPAIAELAAYYMSKGFSSEVKDFIAVGLANGVPLPVGAIFLSGLGGAGLPTGVVTEIATSLFHGLPTPLASEIAQLVHNPMEPNAASIVASGALGLISSASGLTSIAASRIATSIVRAASRTPMTAKQGTMTAAEVRIASSLMALPTAGVPAAAIADESSAMEIASAIYSSIPAVTARAGLALRPLSPNIIRNIASSLASNSDGPLPTAAALTPRALVPSYGAMNTSVVSPKSTATTVTDQIGLGGFDIHEE